MSLERVIVVGKGPVLTSDEIVYGLQMPGVVEYGVQIVRGEIPSRISKLTLWIDPEIRVKAEAEIAELLQSVNDTYKEDTKHYHDGVQEGKF